MCTLRLEHETINDRLGCSVHWTTKLAVGLSIFAAIGRTKTTYNRGGETFAGWMHDTYSTPRMLIGNMYMAVSEKACGPSAVFCRRLLSSNLDLCKPSQDHFVGAAVVSIQQRARPPFNRLLYPLFARISKIYPPWKFRENVAEPCRKRAGTCRAFP